MTNAAEVHPFATLFALVLGGRFGFRGILPALLLVLLIRT